MTLALGDSLKIRAMIYVAAEPIPFFWPMRSFIHHNPLHGLEHLPFDAGAAEGARLFHGRAFLPRHSYQDYLAQGRVDRDALSDVVAQFLTRRDPLPGIDLQHWLMTLLTRMPTPVVRRAGIAGAEDVTAALAGAAPQRRDTSDTAPLKAELRAHLLGDRPVYESVDALFGTDIAAQLDELVIKSCLDFFDEGQSVWGMPGRELGFFAAWRQVAGHNVRLSLRGLHVRELLSGDASPESVIARVMRTLGVPEQHWTGYFTRELARLHGWSGFVRWRASASSYYWNKRYPGDLVDLLAVRLTLGMGLLDAHRSRAIATDVAALEKAIEEKPRRTWLQHELHSGKVLPAYAQQVEMALLQRRDKVIDQVFGPYLDAKCAHEAKHQAARLAALAAEAGDSDALHALSGEQLGQLLDTLREFERGEGMVWLRAMEAKAINELVAGLNYVPPVERDKRPFAQAMFCIDTRSERIRRHLEAVGDYQTFGVAGFFGVPISFMELGKGSENHLCPVLLKPKNLVIEMTTQGASGGPAALTALDKVLHGLKESVLTPFVTVEAVGLLFGFDMVGKTVAPATYNIWRKNLHEDKPPTHLLLDKLSREQADSIVRAVQRAVIGKAVEQDLGLAPERVTDDLTRDLREAAMGHALDADALAAALGIDAVAAGAFVERLRDAYQINPSFVRLQFERLGRIGFSVDEQAHFVGQALRSIGLTRQFSRFVLVVGHGSSSENNPYESALDCGACGGDHGLVNARVLARMANKGEVRQKLRQQGIPIPDDAWFVPVMHNTTTDEMTLHDLDLLPSTHLIYLDRLRSGLLSASRLCAQERLPTLQMEPTELEPAAAYRGAQRNSLDWSQVRPEWGLSRNAYFIIGRRNLTEQLPLDGRAFLHSYDYRVDRKRRLLESILTGPLVVGQWINMEHYFSTVDNERFGSGSKAYHNVAGRFGVMTGNISDLRTGLPSQTVLDQGRPYHEPLRLITVIEAPLEHAQRAVNSVVSVKQLARNSWIRLLVIDPEAGTINSYEEGEWQTLAHPDNPIMTNQQEPMAS